MRNIVRVLGVFMVGALAVGCGAEATLEEHEALTEKTRSALIGEWEAEATLAVFIEDNGDWTSYPTLVYPKEYTDVQMLAGYVQTAKITANLWFGPDGQTTIDFGFWVNGELSTAIDWKDNWSTYEVDGARLLLPVTDGYRDERVPPYVDIVDENHISLIFDRSDPLDPGDGTCVLAYHLVRRQ